MPCFVERMKRTKKKTILSQQQQQQNKHTHPHPCTPSTSADTSKQSAHQQPKPTSSRLQIEARNERYQMLVGWSPRLVGVELNPGPCQGTVSEGKCEQGCTLTPEQVKGFKPDGICDCGHAYLRHGVLTAQSTGSDLHGCYAKDCVCMTYFEGVKSGECKCGHPNFQHSKTAGLKTPPKGTSSPSTLMSSSKRRQENLKDKILVRQDAKDDGSDAVCDICARACQRSVATVAHVIPHSFRALIYTDRHKGNKLLHGKLHSPTDVSNALWLCGTCDGAFEGHEIEIDETGTIIISREFLSHCDPFYMKLNGKKVWWHKKMNKDGTEYPPGNVLSYRKKHIPPVNSKKGQAFRKKITTEWEQMRGTKRKLSEFEHESDSSDEEGTSTIEQKSKKKPKKQRTEEEEEEQEQEQEQAEEQEEQEEQEEERTKKKKVKQKK